MRLVLVSTFSLPRSRERIERSEAQWLGQNPEFQNLKFEISDLKVEISEVRLENSDLRFEISDLKVEISEVRLENPDLKFEISDLKFETSDLKVASQSLRFISTVQPGRDQQPLTTSHLALATCHQAPATRR